MSKLEEQLINILIATKENIKNNANLEEKLGIRICTREEDHIFVASSNPKKNYKTFTMKPLNLTKAIDFTIETEELEQTCLLCGKKQVLVKTLKPRK